MVNQSETRWIKRHRVLVSISSIVVVLIAAGVFAFTVVFENSTIPVSISEAIDRFRGNDTDSDKDDLLETGVYTYTTVGQESVKTFLSASRDYPSDSTITVTAVGCGVRLEWTPLRERNEFMEVCRIDGGIALIRYGGAHEFFGMRDEYFVDCPEGTWLVPPSSVTQLSPVSCAGGNLGHDRISTMSGTRTITIDGEQVEGMEIVTTISTTGAMNGTITTTKVISADGKVLSWSDEVDGLLPSPVGDVEYKESFTLTLASLVPSR